MSTGSFPQPQFPGYAKPRRAPRMAAMAGGALAVVSAALLVVGTFLPLSKVTQASSGGRQQESTVTGWARTFDPPLTGSLAEFYSKAHTALVGIPLSAIALLLVIGAVLAFLGARGSRVVLFSGTAAALAAVLMLGAELESLLSYNDADPDASTAARYEIGLGAWLVAGGAALSLIAVIVAAQRGNPASAAGDVTPPQGFPAPVQQQPQYPPRPPYQQYAPPPQYPPRQQQPYPQTPPPPQQPPAPQQQQAPQQPGSPEQFAPQPPGAREQPAPQPSASQEQFAPQPGAREQFTSQPPASQEQSDLESLRGHFASQDEPAGETQRQPYPSQDPAQPNRPQEPPQT
ncbi:hypothetical protein FPZ12_022720 [Amycolatopsis acidicola]|uniref:Uncharacterized protein n=1 Tax=Amycolatopsis acidicola TaxID=2596893 RepID=A0A5N0UZT6_9PSEU|nr:hypothetical protein [Amycolatopsis acidicola]KAA9158407.1 hypothetical protein FPZ12_022720 [Amycolatopsis acidicola]